MFQVEVINWILKEKKIVLLNIIIEIIKKNNKREREREKAK